MRHIKHTNSFHSSHRDADREDALAACLAGYLGDIDALRHLAQQLPIDADDYDGRTALHLACSEGRLDAVKVLVEELGADINVKDHFGGTPLDDAVRHKHILVQTYLREKEAQHGEAFARGAETIAHELCETAYHGDARKLRRLVEREFFNPNSSDYDKRTPLHLAASEGHLDVVKLLVEDMLVEISPVDRWDGTPLDDALRHHHDSIAAYLKSKGAMALSFASVLDASSLSSKRTANFEGTGHPRSWASSAAEGHALCSAAYAGRAEEVRRLVREEGYDPNATDYDRRTALHLAAAEGRVEVLRVLIVDLATKSSPKDRWGQTPLDEAIRSGHEEAIAFLKSKEAKTCEAMAQQREGLHELLEAVATGDTSRLRHLVLHAGVDVNPGNGDGRTALHLAATAGRLGVATTLLLELHADPRPRDRWGRTPLDNAVQGKHDAVIELLRTHGGGGAVDLARRSEEVLSAARLCRAAAAGDVAAVRVIISGGTPVLMGDYDARTALHVAASEGQLAVVRLLVEEFGASPSPSDRWGSTPLDDALRRGHSKVEKYLKSRRGTKTFACHDDDTASSVVVRGVSRFATALCAAAYIGDLPALRSLAERASGAAGAMSINCADYDGRTALHLGASEGRLEVVQMLVSEFGASPNVEDRWGGTPMQDAMNVHTAAHHAVADFLRSVGGSRVGYSACVVPGMAAVMMTTLAYHASKGHAEGVRRSLIQARSHGGESLMRELLLAPDSMYGNSPMHWAAFSGSMPCVEVLFNTAGDVVHLSKLLESRNGELATPLHVAARFNAPELASYLLDMRADPNSVDKLGSTVLHSCCKYGNSQVAHRILRWERTSLEVPCEGGKTPLMAAVASGSAETVRVLLEADARFDGDGRRKEKQVMRIARNFVQILKMRRNASERSTSPVSTKRANQRNFCGTAKASIRKDTKAALSASSCFSSSSREGFAQRVGNSPPAARQASISFESEVMDSTVQNPSFELQPSDFLSPATPKPGELLLQLALDGSHFPVLRLLLLWGRRHFKSGTDPIWCAGIFSKEHAASIVVDLWAPALRGEPEPRETAELFALLLLCVAVDEEAPDKPASRSISLLALEFAQICRTKGKQELRDTTVQLRLLTASAIFELLACGFIDALSLLGAGRTTVQHSSLQLMASEAVRDAFFEPTVKFAAAYECEIFLAMPMVLHKVRSLFWPSKRRCTRHHQQTATNQGGWASFVAKVVINMLALPFLLFVPDDLAHRWERSYRAAILDGRERPYHLVWVLPPGKALTWFSSSTLLCGILTFIPPKQHVGVEEWEVVLMLYFAAMLFDELKELATVGLMRHLNDPFNLLDEGVVISLGVMLTCRLLVDVPDHSDQFGRTGLNEALETLPTLQTLYNVTGLRVESSSVFYVGTAAQAIGSGLMFLRLMKVLYMVPHTGMMLLMTIHMVRDLIGFLVILFFFLISCTTMLYVWIRASEPYLSFALTDGRSGVDAFFLTIYTLIDEALVMGEPMFHDPLEQANRGGYRHTGPMRAFLFCIGIYFYVIVALLLLNLLIARFSKSFSLIDERHDLNTAVVFARVCLAPEYQQLLPAPFSLLRDMILLTSYMGGRALSWQMQWFRSATRSPKTAPIDEGKGKRRSLRLETATHEISPAQEAANFINRSVAPDAAFFPEAAVDYVIKHYYRVDQHRDYHLRI
ncbi:hypothetical protein AB1Y20_013564 [Prymnesium parvum]|uniref:Ion transport domain-containing protein n=1 Tax=Prymnesium parvum TaxID=97485 RepID=A0AB34IIY2_PRYPA